MMASQRRTVFVATSVASLFACLLGVLLVRQHLRAASVAPEQVWQGQQRPRQSGAPSQPRGGAGGEEYLVGVGKADITGPVVEIGFAGYADLSQRGTGLRQRIYSRAFIVGDVGRPTDRFVYLVLDTQSGDTAVRYGILDGLAALGPDYAVYGRSNVAVTGTHSHAGPGAWFNYLLPQITSLGYDAQSYQAIVDGAVLSIKRAHESLGRGYLDYATVNITDGNLSRSLYGYMANPASERAQYQNSVDKEMAVLKFQRVHDGRDLGVLTWYPVHGTSLLQNNTHVAGDNKGVAAVMLERAMARDAGLSDFVAAFSQANVGDTTPNVGGAYCDDGSGAPCSYEKSTCADGRSQSCHGRGPRFDKLDLGVSSCYEIGRRQYDGAMRAYHSFATSTATPIVGPTVKSFHFYQDMQYYKFALENGTEVQTCPAALGYSFAGGTTDGPGAFDFTQADSGTPSASPVWRVVRGLLREPSAAQKTCQYPKPVLLDVGELSTPYAWSPNVVDMQMLRVGQLVIIVAPAEATTMAGRRWKAAVRKAAPALTADTAAEPVVLLGGPANTYAHYVATAEEYLVQRYEGASTLFGPWQLDAFVQLTTANMPHLAPGATSAPDPGPSPPDNRHKSLSFIAAVAFDSPPIGRSFGDVLLQPGAGYRRGELVEATFVGANPRNNLRLGGTFAAVERLVAADFWLRVRDDDDWFLLFTWTRTSTVLAQSQVVIGWEVEADAEPGTYRIKYYGDGKALLGGRITPFEGTSNSFTVA